MANDIDHFFQTLVVAANEATQVLMSNVAFLDRVYLNYNPYEVGAIGNTYNVPIPDAVEATDRANGTNLFDNATTGDKSVTLSHRAQKGYLVRSFEQFRTPADIRAIFLDSRIKAVIEKVNADLSVLANATAFNVHGAVACTGGFPTTAKYLEARGKLSAAKVPVRDLENMTCFLDSTVFHKLLGNSDWTSATAAGNDIAGSIRLGGDVRVAYSTQIREDQSLSALTTGSSPNRSYKGLLMHKYAIALMTRRLPEPPNNAQCTFINYKGLPLRITAQFDIDEDATKVSVDCGYGMAVIRPEMGVVFNIAE